MLIKELNKDKLIEQFNNETEELLSMLEKQSQFKLDSIYVEVLFNDYDRIEKFYTNDIEKNLKLNFKKMLEQLLSKENCDTNYTITYQYFYKIVDKNYLFLSNFVDNYLQQNNELTNKHLKNKYNIIEVVKTYYLKTPKKNVPKNIKLVKMLNDNINYIIDTNGETNFDKIEEMKKILNKFT